MLKRSFIASGAIVAVALAGSARAQTASPGVPANRIDQRPPIPDPTGPTPRFVQARNPTRPIKPFLLRSVEVGGASLAQTQFRQRLAQFVGQRVDNRTLTQIVNAAADVYADSQVALYSVLVPEQDFKGGALRLTVIEGYVSQVNVRGRINPTRKHILAIYLRRIAQERPLTKATLQRNVSDIKALPGFVPDLKLTSGDAPGQVQLNVGGRDPRVQMALGINNRGTAFLGKTQAQADVLINAPLTGSDQLHATVVLPTEPRLFQYYALNYSTGLGTHGTSISVYGSYLRTRPTLLPLAGDAWAYGTQLTQVLKRDYHDTLAVSAGLDGIDSNNALFGEVLSNDRVRSARVGTSATHSAGKTYFAASGTISTGLKFLNERVNVDYSDAGFVKANVRGNFNQQIGRDFVSRLSGFGQFSNNRLPASEQMALGGEEFGRAYEASIITGDHGYAGAYELAWHPQRGLPKRLSGSEVYAYVDGGRTFLHDRVGITGFSSSLASVGAGVRALVAKRIQFQFEAAHGLTNPVFYENHEYLRALFSVKTVL